MKPVRLLPPALLLAACAQPSAPPRPSPTLLPPGSSGAAADPEGLGSAAFDPERAEAVLDATWYGDYLVSNDAFVLDEHPCVAGVTRADADATIQLDLACPLDLHVGSVLVSGVGGGFVRRVEAITAVAATVTAVTSPARLSDVLFVGRAFDAIPIPLVAGDLPPGNARDPWTYDFSGLPLDSVGAGDNRVDIKVATGSVMLDPSVDFGLDIDWFDWDRPWPKLEKADLGLRTQAATEIELQLTGHGAIARNGTVDLFAFDKDFGTKIGPLPVGGTVHFDVDLTWEAEADGDVDARGGAGAELEAGLGGRYVDGDWENTSGFTWEDHLIGPTLTLDGNIRLRGTVVINARIDLMSAGTAEANAALWAEARAALDCGDIDWAVDAGIALDASLDYDILGQSGSHDFDVFDWERAPLAHGVIPVPIAALDPTCTEGPSDAPSTTDDSGPAEGGSDVFDESPEERGIALATEACVGGVDEDEDGAVDCADSECADSMVCGSECHIWDNLSCGDIVTASTAGLVSDRPSRISGYAINTGSYTGPEVGFAFRAPTTGDVAFRLVDPSPSVIDHDVIVLHTPTGVCDSKDAIAWGGNEATVDVSRGEQYIVVVDGYDGDEGTFTLEVDCAP